MPAEIDTGASVIALKSSLFTALLGILDTAGTCTTLANTMVCPCSSIDETKTLYFSTTTKNTSRYGVPISKLKVPFTGTQCGLLIFSIDQDKILLGLPLLREYYAAFDEDNRRIGLAPHDAVSCIENRPDPIVPEKSNLRLILIIVGAILAFLVLLIYFIREWRRRCQLERYLPTRRTSEITPTAKTEKKR